MPTPFLSLLPRVSVLLVVPLLGWAAPDSVQQSAIGHLNQARRLAGMTPFAWDDRLARAAAGHAGYLARNLELGHEQAAGKPGFTGASPGQRALLAGFEANQVSENIHASVGAETGPGEWVDNLLTGIYHRTRFLDFHVDLLGLAVSDGDFRVVVFNLANRTQAELCADTGPEYPGGSYYHGICRDAGRKVPATDWERARSRVQLSNPEWVVWPPDGAEGVVPVFAEETPDPLPDLEVAGNPLSLHFNPARVEAVELERFELIATDDGPVPARLLDAASDPNGLLGPLDFALFPLRRLDWNTGYRAEAEFRTDGERHRIAWHFRTRDPGVPVLILQANGETLVPAPGSQRFAVQVPADSGVPIIRSLRYRSSPGLAVRARIYDANTLWFELTGPRRQGEVEVRLGAGLGFRLHLQ